MRDDGAEYNARVEYERIDCRQEFVPDFRTRVRKKSKILFCTLGGISSGRMERVTETVFL